MRPVLPVAAVLLITVLSGCGEETPDPPRDATKAAFCEAIQSGVLAHERDEEQALREYADRLARTGTPSDIPSEARAGFEQTIEEAHEGEDSELERNEATGDEFDRAKRQTDHQLTGVEGMMAINQYVMRTCRGRFTAHE
ncbi:MAG: hypothetical protein ACI379_10935 [Nocardioides sp.]|uniref:hypothetical protein n=1 Tax=Nocardioides sp. TaxID=35761 RepID=UPI003F118BA3